VQPTDALLTRLGFERSDRAEILASPSRPEHAEERGRARRLLVDGIGGKGELVGWPTAPPGDPWFHVHVFVSALDEILSWHAAREIPEDVSWATLRDLGRNVAIHRRAHGVGGFDEHWWLTLHFRGLIYELGRLQFDRVRDALGVHIPEAGPLAPAACDASFAWAREFFARHFPEEEHRVGRCRSWLLDPQLAEYLDAGSNIVRFQRRFELSEDVRDGSEDVLWFVFRRRGAVDLEALPQRTTLERAVVTHLRAGRSWHERSGTVEL
jgi:GNAT-like C-terminal domain/N-acyltransferase N-terminal domain